MKNTKELVGHRIKELRKGAGLSQHQLSELIGVESKYVSRIELGKSFPHVETLQAIAKALEVELKDLFDFSHLQAEEINRAEIDRMLDGMSKDDLKLVHKVIKAITR